MDPEVIPVGDIFNTTLSRDVLELSKGAGGLRILITTAPASVNVRCIVEVTFLSSAAFKVLDEGDVFCSWSSEIFQSGHLVYEVLRNGWIDTERQSSGMLAISGSAVRHREWFIPTANDCLSVLSQQPPLLRILG